MPDMSALKDLRDIHLPPDVSAFPPAPIFYALAALLIIAILLYLRYQKHQRLIAPKKEALETLSALEADYANKPNAKKTAAAITTLLKQVALVYHPRTDVASLHGEAWLLFLQNTSKAIDFKNLEKSLLDTPFNPKSKENLGPLFIAARAWIKQRRKPCLN